MIYLVEDDRNIRELIIYTLNSTGFEAKGFESAKELDRALKTQSPELLLLDIMLPGEDGLSILRRLRQDPAYQSLPVIMLTAKSGEYDKVIGLDSGADDYVAKPFGMMELVSRIKALLRRSGGVKSQPKMYCGGGLEIDPERHTVLRSGEKIELTLKEFELLCALFKAGGRVLTREQLLSDIWGYDFGGETRTVDVHVRTLRQKLGESGDVIKTVRGIGYKLDDAALGGNEEHK